MSKIQALSKLQFTGMDSSQAKKKVVPPSEKEKTLSAADPFASDIFAVSKTTEDSQSAAAEPTNESATEKKAGWIWRIPKVSRPKIEWDALWQKLPPDFSDALPPLLAESLAGYLNLTDENLIEFLFISKREANEIPEENNSWRASVGIENSQAEFIVEIDDGFAAWLVDRMLGEKFSERAPVRDLTPSEVAVLEFLVVNLTHETNAIVKAPLFTFRAFDRKVPARRFQKQSADSNSLLISSWQIVHGFQQSVVKLYLTPEALNALQANENKLLTRAPRREMMRRSFENRIKDVRARVFLGEAQATMADVAGLETGDVVLLENYAFSVGSNDFYGGAEVFLGDGERVKIIGAFESFEAELLDEFDEENTDDGEFIVHRIKSNRALQFSIERIEELENPQFLEKSMQEENTGLAGEENGEFFDDDESGGVPIENLAVTLRVELEARRLSLAEVGNLRVNQTIELGARATDPVNLLIDNKIIARGELVEVEGQLGVRIIQILR